MQSEDCAKTDPTGGLQPICADELEEVDDRPTPGRLAVEVDHQVVKVDGRKAF